MNPRSIGDKTSRFDSICTVMGAQLANMKHPAIMQSIFSFIKAVTSAIPHRPPPFSRPKLGYLKSRSFQQTLSIKTVHNINGTC
jgi:hypothetical protein